MDSKFFKKSEQIYWVWLSLKLNNRNKVFQKLLDVFGGSVYEIYEADEQALGEADNLNEFQKRSLLDKGLGEAISIYDYCKRNNVGIVNYGDAKYPDGLRAIKDPPILFYYMGTLPDFNNKLSIAVVGTRKMTEYGMRSGYKIAYELASAGAVVVSGMAFGVDSIAHAGAIGGRGKTVAVLGCGIDVIYPKQHRRLRKFICENGAVITTYHPSTAAYKNNFPERNSIISALCDGTLIVEAPMRSGALITADCAAEQSRTVYALPGSIEEPMSEGPNHLIKNGAVAITSARDILEYYFENHSTLVDPIKLRHGELSSDFDMDILQKLGISADCYGKGPKDTPKALLKKLNDELNNNKEQNGDYYAVPEIKRIKKSVDADKKTTPVGNAEEVASSKNKNEAPKPVDEGVLATLTDEQRSIFNDMPCDKPISVDFIAKGGYAIGTIMATLTILEIKGLISSLPGGMYIRK